MYIKVFILAGNPCCTYKGKFTMIHSVADFWNSFVRAFHSKNLEILLDVKLKKNILRIRYSRFCIVIKMLTIIKMHM